MRDVLAHGPLDASYLIRGPGYPLVLAGARLAFGTELAALWLVPVLAGLAAWSVMRITRLVSGDDRAALGAGLLFVAWPASIQYAAEILTDAPHAFLAVAALAATLAWRARGGASRACGAGLAWIACQSLRPTFFFVPAVLPLVLVGGGGVSPTRRREAIGVLIASLIAPSFVVGSNWARHGVATASAIGAETVSCYAVPRLRYALGEGDFFELRDAAFARYRAIPYPERIAVERADARAVLLAHPLEALASNLRELRRQLLSPPRAYSRPEWATLYPRWTSLAGWINGAFWLLAAAGTAGRARRDPRLALFLVLSFVGVMVPAATSALIENRLRLPLDLWAMPLVALAARDALVRLGAARRGGVATASD